MQDFVDLRLLTQLALFACINELCTVLNSKITKALHQGNSINFVFSFLYMYVSSYLSWVASFFRQVRRQGYD